MGNPPGSVLLELCGTGADLQLTYLSRLIPDLEVLDEDDDAG